MVDTVYIEDIEKEFYEEIKRSVRFTENLCNNKVVHCEYQSNNLFYCNLFKVTLFRRTHKNEDLILRCEDCLKYF